MSKELVSGIVGGLVGGSISKALMKIPTPRSNKVVVSSQLLEPGETRTLISNTYKHGIILFHGDGDPEVTHTVTVNGVTTELMGDEQAIEIISNETVEITATNTSTEPKSTMTIEILSLVW